MSVVLVDTPSLYIRVSDETARTHKLCPTCGGNGYKYELDYDDSGWPGCETGWFYNILNCSDCCGIGLVGKVAPTTR